MKNVGKKGTTTESRQGWVFLPNTAAYYSCEAQDANDNHHQKPAEATYGYYPTGVSHRYPNTSIGHPVWLCQEHYDELPPHAPELEAMKGLLNVTRRITAGG